MTESDVPDPADNKPSQAEGDDIDAQDLETAVGPVEDKPSQAEGDQSEA